MPRTKDTHLIYCPRCAAGKYDRKRTLEATSVKKGERIVKVLFSCRACGERWIA